MHLLIDIRSSHPADFSLYFYAKIWVKYWTISHPHDTISWIFYDDQDIIEQNGISIPRKTSWLHQKKIASHSHGPDRILSFSREPILDPSIKTILHMYDIAEFLYPQHIENWFSRKKRENGYKKILKKASQIIVPHLDTGREIAEIFQISEEKMNVIPYLMDTHETIHDPSVWNQYGVSPDSFFTEWTPWEEWNPLGILTAYARYIHDYDGERKLIISGNLWENLWHITSYIRSLDLIDRVKIIWLLPMKERQIIISHSSAWIYIGSYYGGGPTITEAEVFDIPLILSDIPVLWDYWGTHIHPNHLEELPQILKNIEKKEISGKRRDNTSIMNVYTKLIAE